MGSLLIGLAILLLLEDRWFSPWFPVFFVCYLTASILAARELLSLLPKESRPNELLTLDAVTLIAAMNWWPAVRGMQTILLRADAWHLIGACVLVALAIAVLREMRIYRGPDQIVARISLTAFVVLYIGVLPSFLAQIRFLDASISTVALALAVFVPKGNDIGAYFTGKFLTGRVIGRTPMTPLLSPKKTWQGAVGGMLASVLVAVGVQANWPVIPGGWIGSVGLGVTVGFAGIMGDLAESLIKRDLQTKDASQTVPGFGGVLDVVDSLLFAAPVVWIWFVV